MFQTAKDRRRTLSIITERATSNKDNNLVQDCCELLPSTYVGVYFVRLIIRYMLGVCTGRLRDNIS